MASASSRTVVVVALASAACGFDSSGSGGGGSAAEIGDASTSGAVDDAGPSDGADATVTTGGADDDTGGGATTSADDGAGESSSGTTGEIDWAPFGAPNPIPELNSIYSDDDPTLRGDLLEIVFASNRSATSEDLMIARRPSIDVDFGESVPLPAPLNDPYTNETTPELSIDGLVLTFASDRSGGAGLQDIYVTSRKDVLSAWAAPMRVDELATSALEVALVTTVDGLTGYFCAFVDYVDLEQLMRTTRADTDADWGTPVALTINSPATDCSPWVDGDGTELWFDSLRLGGPGLDDIWHAEMDGVNVTAPEPVAELNSALRDQDPWLSPVGDIVVFASDRAGDMDLYYAVRTPL